MNESVKPAYLEKVDRRGDIAVWIVDGSYIRGHIDEEFTNFGQHYRYLYIPSNEFWIDREAEHDERLWKRLESGLSVWIVNGRLVRSTFDIDFTAGGHDYVYEFVPENEVWIDDAIVEQERGYVLLHELHDALSAEGWA